MIKVLSIAGSDPSGGAGVQADLKLFHMLGAYGMAIPAALTVQNSKGVTATEAVSASLLLKQAEALFADLLPSAVKTGMLLTRQNVLAVAKVVSKYNITNLVVDPVLASSSGKLAAPRGWSIVAQKKSFSPGAHYYSQYSRG